MSEREKIRISDARKALNMCRNLNVKVLGFVENMSGEVFGEGTERAARSKKGSRYRLDEGVFP